LTGFLGSGKTTILQHLLSLPEMARTALIINEFGEVSVDHLLVESAEEKMVLLSNGCVCCSVRGDLVQAVVSLFQRMRNDEIPPFERILLETTGLADPAPIVQSLIGPALNRYPVYFDSIATTVDTTNVLTSMKDNPQVHSQIAVADSLLLTKTDLSSEESIEAVEREVTSLNPRAKVHHLAHGKCDAEVVFGQQLLNPSASAREQRNSARQLLSSTDASTGHHGIQSFVIRRDKPLRLGVLDAFLRALCGYKSQDLLRFKGLVDVVGSDKPTLVHGVQAVMHPPTKLRKWPDKERSTHLVFITRNISETDVENLLQGIESGFR
jgi:G3E family GTPase